MVREDYYKFAHSLLPHTALKYGNSFVQKVLNDSDMFIKVLKTNWNSIQIDKRHKRSAVPEFEIEIRSLTKEHSVILLKTPSANKCYEAPYIGIVYDKDYNTRYFTYEIAKGEPGEVVYLICEWTDMWDHYNYGCHKEMDLDKFIEVIAQQSVYEML